MIRRLFSKRYIRILLWLFITLVTLIVLLYVWTNWSGRRRWAATKAMIEREGETLDFHKLLPETPPEAQNLLAIEPLRGIAEVIENNDSKGEPGAKRKALEDMKWSVSISGSVVPAANGLTLGQATNIQEWVKFLRLAKYLELPTGQEVTGRDLLAALDAKFPLLKQLADETANRPLAMLTPSLRERERPELLLVMRMPYVGSVQSLANVLALRAKAAVAAGAGAEAARSILAIHRLAQAFDKEPLLIGFLVGNTLEMMALETLWVDLRERVFEEDDLRLLQDSFAADQTTSALLLALRGELATGANAMEFLQQAANGQRAEQDSLAGFLSTNGRDSLRLLPGGLFDHWKSAVVELELQHLILPLKSGGLRESVRNGDALETELMQKSNLLQHPDHLMARLMLPAVSMVSNNALMQAARRQQALAALALERFYMKHARYPATLTELTPEFLPAVPRDPCDGKPLRYLPTPAGRYQLWSVAFDDKDDDGKVTVDSKGKTKLSKRDYLGDWTWQYEPVKTGSKK